MMTFQIAMKFGYEQNKGIRKNPSLHGIKKINLFHYWADELRMDTLLRMNIFTPIEEITTSYLTSTSSINRSLESPQGANPC